MAPRRTQLGRVWQYAYDNLNWFRIHLLVFTIVPFLYVQTPPFASTQQLTTLQLLRALRGGQPIYRFRKVPDRLP